MARNHETIYWLVGGLKSSDEISFNDYILKLQNPRFTKPWSFTIQK
jgi:hypothetical protein